MKTITDLRESLFDVMEKLKSGEITVDQAKAISGVAQTIVNSAKVENEYLRATEQNQGSGFITDQSVKTGPQPLKVARWQGA
ncbi:MAG: hypothetical protein CME36_09595 [unclassified Hahellaceae]|nr:hypothetical protein [Hahellaceae bacterium]|tara:strand:+ start:24505 stop:24750 length:246 start_codon:yes stop_codon:yes gene_type:complete